MAPITPNPSAEAQNKLLLRGVTRGGANPWYEAIDPAIMVNAASTTSGILELSVNTNVTTFTISGAGGNSTTITGTSTGTQVSGLIAALAAGPLSGQTFYVNAGNANYLYNTTTSIIVPSGAVLTIISGTGGVPTITAFAFSGTGAEGFTYPNYVGVPNAVPTWVDDATVHATQVGFNGQAVQSTTLSGVGLVTQQQVRQIQTSFSETQQYAGYQASYSGNLYQTGQKRTYRQQS